MANAIPTASAAIAAAVMRGELDSVEIARAHIDRVLERNAALNAIVEFDPAVPLADARRVAARVAEGEILPLAGVPLVVKDCIWVEGQPVNQGCRALADFTAPRDAMAVERARRAGAVVLGLGNMSELGCKDITDNQLYGPTRHPADFRLTPGGSSGGCAVALASGMAPLALGTDAGGSSRRPPAHVGVVGFKPSNGVMADPFGFPSITPWVDTVCPMGVTVADTRLLFEAVVGADARDPLSVDLPARHIRPLSELKIAFSPRLGLDVVVENEIAAAIDAIVRALAGHGLDIVEADPIWPASHRAAMVSDIELAGLAAYYGDTQRRDPSLFDPYVGRQIAAGGRLGAADVVRARDASLAVYRAAQSFFQDFDLLLCPTLACVSWNLERVYPETIDGRPVEPRAHAAFTPLFNHAGTPAITIPCGSGRDGLPIGLQTIGRRFDDRQVLAAAEWVEAVLGDAARPWLTAPELIN